MILWTVYLQNVIPLYNLAFIVFYIWDLSSLANNAVDANYVYVWLLRYFFFCEAGLYVCVQDWREPKHIECKPILIGY